MQTDQPSAGPTGAVSTAPTKTSTRLFVEDLIVTAFGMATSAAVAYGSFYLGKGTDSAVYTWMADLVIPIGAILCGFVAAVGYWIGSRLFNHKPSRLLLCNIVLVSLGTFFSIHHLDYTHAAARGTPLPQLISFPDYLVAVTEHMTYKDSHSSGAGMELGKWGWGVAGLQVLGFCLGGFGVYGILAATPYCHRCSMYFRNLWRRATKWKDLEAMSRAYQSLSALLDAGQLQAAVDQHAMSGDSGKFGMRGFLSMNLRECPGCAERRLDLLAQRRNGNQVATIARRTVTTHDPIQKATAAPA